MGCDPRPAADMTKMDILPARLLLGLVLLMLASAAAAQNAHATAPARHAAPRTILFIGNSFTFGANSPVRNYRPDTVTDLTRRGIGGVPALFRRFTVEAGLDYRVSLETEPGKGLNWHWDNRRALLDRAWDDVVLQDASVLNFAHHGDPSLLIDYSGRFARMFAARNPRVRIGLTATWSRPDMVYRGSGKWFGQPITRMALDLRAAYDRARAAEPRIARVHPVGQAFNCAIQTGLADPNPYDGLTYGQVDLWSYDHYHGSTAGYYLEALTIFVDVTGKDPRAFGGREQAAVDLGLSPDHAARLQAIAWRVATSGGHCGQ